eukprot:TRINITY_DN7269_c0_g1_i1.p1 TRINITY_DN7269_c0_g1~~TRINITY_DN7269_c0_g1_i1.p1  ORF type:complete len:162 (+),score=35.08 TRINITY_DN7269_c0_g1_i1:546-1031(+)
MNRKSALVYGLASAYTQSKAASIPIKEALTEICKISYIGDIRFWFRAENPRKVQNLVEGNYNHLLPIYKELLADISMPLTDEKVKASEEELLRLWEENMVESMQFGGKGLGERVESAKKRISGINRKGSFKGILCGAFSTDVVTSAKYVFEKLAKGFKAKR